MANEGANFLLRVLDGRAKKIGSAPPALDLGTIKEDGSLLTDGFPRGIPPKDYIICRAAEDLSSINGQAAIKNDVRNYVNDTLDRLDFGDGVRKEIGKRRVTDVLLPMFVTQYL